LTKLGLAEGATGRAVAARLTDAELLTRGRVHPIKVLVAARTYTEGVGRGGSWTPHKTFSNALNDAFYNAYGAVEPSDKRMLAAVDWSGSMAYQRIANMPLYPFEAAGAIALVTEAVESEVTHIGFASSVARTDISKYRRLDDVLAYYRKIATGQGTDCALPMLWALQEQVPVDTFVVITDGETWAGRVHPYQALDLYRQKMGIPARMVQVAMTATGHTLRRNDDPDSLDVVGFDTNVPQMISDFSAGRL
jgi:60 kDa SS-A/Ro ribonucleoprotein